MGFVGHDLVELELGEAGIETVGMLGKERRERGAVADLQRQLIIAADIGPRIRRRRCRRRGSSRRGRHQRHVVAAERAIDIGLLPVIGGLQHIVAHEAERAAHVEARRGQMPR
jgi:hypothetical protein